MALPFDLEFPALTRNPFQSVPFGRRIHVRVKLPPRTIAAIGECTMADGNVVTDVLGRGRGTLAQGNLWFTAPLSKNFSLNVGPDVSWADARYQKSFYAVTPQEAAISPQLSTCSTHSGIRDVHWNGLIEWQLLSHYRIGIQVSLMQLKASAADRLITEQKNQRNVVGWVAYTIR